jgi:hypothetical protein
MVFELSRSSNIFSESLYDYKYFDYGGDWSLNIYEFPKICTFNQFRRDMYLLTTFSFSERLIDRLHDYSDSREREKTVNSTLYNYCYKSKRQNRTINFAELLDLTLGKSGLTRLKVLPKRLSNISNITDIRFLSYHGNWMHLVFENDTSFYLICCDTS